MMNVEYKQHYDMPEISGTITASENHLENLKKVKISFSDASMVAQGAVENGQITRGHIGVVSGFLVYKFSVVDGQENIHKVIVDAGEKNILYLSGGKSWEDLKQSRHEKWSHYKEIVEKFSQMSSEEMTQKFAQFKEMKQAFDSIPDEDKQTIKSHFKEIKGQYRDLSSEERVEKKEDFKEKMDAFAKMTLDEKIRHLEEFATKIKSQN